MNVSGTSASTGSAPAAAFACTCTQPTSEGSLWCTSPPAARVSNWAPRHRPITGTPSASASRSSPISSSIHGKMSLSCVFAVPPHEITAS